MNYNELSLEQLVEVALDKGCKIYIVGGVPGTHNDPRIIAIPSYFTESHAKVVIIKHLNIVDEEDKNKGWIAVVENTIEKYKNKNK